MDPTLEPWGRWETARLIHLHAVLIVRPVVWFATVPVGVEDWLAAHPLKVVVGSKAVEAQPDVQSLCNMPTLLEHSSAPNHPTMHTHTQL